MSELRRESLKVSRGSQARHDIELPGDSEVRWSFTCSNDIGFEAHFRAADGQVSRAWPHGRLQAHKQEQHGRFVAASPGVLELTFDNSFSRFRGKAVQLSWSVRAAAGLAPGSGCSTPYGDGVVLALRDDGFADVHLSYGHAALQLGLLRRRTMGARPGG